MIVSKLPVFFSIRYECGSPVKVGRPEITVIIFSFYMNLALPAKKPTKSQGKDFLWKSMHVLPACSTHVYVLGKTLGGSQSFVTFQPG